MSCSLSLRFLQLTDAVLGPSTSAPHLPRFRFGFALAEASYRKVNEVLVWGSNGLKVKSRFFSGARPSRARWGISTREQESEDVEEDEDLEEGMRFDAVIGDLTTVEALDAPISTYIATALDWEMADFKSTMSPLGPRHSAPQVWLLGVDHSRSIWAVLGRNESVVEGAWWLRNLERKKQEVCNGSVWIGERGLISTPMIATGI